MNFLKALQAQFAGTWQRYNAQQRTLLLAALAIGMAAIVGVGFWSARSEYMVLAKELGPSQAAELVSRLQTAGINYELSYSGSELSVPKQDWNRARLASGNLLDPLHSEESTVEGGIFDDPNQIKDRQHRQLELSISRMIMQLNGVAHAEVHISRPESSPFIRERRPATASVVLSFRPGVMFDRQQAASIVSIVSHAVGGLNPDDITVADTQGRILSEKQSGMGADVAMQFEYQRRLETDLAAKAESMLSQILGPGRAIVRVTADVDFTQTTRVEDTYDPDAKVKKSEKITTEDTTNQESTVGGSGTAANVEATPAASSATRGAQSSKSETIETEYQNTKRTNTVVEAPGRLQRLTVSAAVDIPTPADGSAPKLTEELVKNVIKQAVGFDTERDGEDAITVVVGPLAGLPAMDDPALGGAGPWKQYEGLVRNASLGIASLVVLAIALLTLKKMRPVVVTPPTTEGMTVESSRRLSAIARQVEDDPKAIAQMLETWLGEDNKARQDPVRTAA
ncbi:MAG: flagellar M-ring protein FliF [Planctomycetaceae bacterium]|nr:flagellar M-ring protein FliF [Planctomycetaceae bacterium]